MTWLTHLRTIVIALGAFTLCCGLLTQMLARALGYAAALGPPLLDLGSLRLYPPFSLLHWSFTWAAAAPSLLLLSLCLTLVCVLAAYAVAVVAAKLEPVALAPASPWRGLATWREIGDYGLLRDTGLALGAVRRHALARTHIVRSSADAVLFLGQPRHSDAAVLAALASWSGHLVLVDARGDLTAKLGRAEVLRLAPGRGDTLCINPLLALRSGLEAWGDARRLAASLLSDQPSDAFSLDVLALLILDQLLCAPLEQRTLAGLRRRLLDPAALIADLCRRWCASPPADAQAAIWEMTRAARAMRADPEAARASLARIDQALALFAKAGLAHATGAHQLNLAHLLAAPAPQTLVLSMERGGANAAPLIRALLAQLVALCASGAGELLIAVEAEAAQRLAEQANAALPASAQTRVVIQAVNFADAERLAGVDASRAAIVAIGPQTAASAETVSKRAGACVIFAITRPCLPRRRALLFPHWRSVETARLPAAALAAAAPEQALLLAPEQKPVRMRCLASTGATSFAGARAAAPHDWSAPPIIGAPATLAPPANAGAALAAPGPPAAKLRRMLSRTTAAPKGKGAPAS